jgi:type II secretory pathway pseudopilin PulG
MITAAILIGCQAKQEAKKPPRPRFNPQAVAVEARAQDIAAGIRRYQRDVGQYPQKLDDLFSSDAKGWKGPYVGSGPPVIPDGQSHGAQDLLTDLWGQPFEYVSGTESPQVVSPGPDKQRGTPDDIIVPVTPGGSPGETNASH